MKRIVWLLVAVIVAGGGYWAWTKNMFGPAGQTAETPGRGGGDRAVAVVTVPAETRTIANKRHTIGYVEPLATVTIKSRIDGQIVSQKAVDGQMVKEGDVLFTLDDRAVQAALDKDMAQLARDQSVGVRVAGDLKRAQDLLARNAGTQQAVDNATAEMKSNEASIKADMAQIEVDKVNISYTQIKAPISGRLGSVLVTPGNLVKANDTGGLVTITQMKPVRVSFTLPDRELAPLRAALDSGRPTPIQVSDRGTQAVKAEGVLQFIDSTIDTGTGTITAKGLFENARMELWPGQYLGVSVALTDIPDATVIPTVAIQPGQKGPYIFVAANGKAEMRQIAILAADGDMTAISSGARPGEHVVVEGQLRLAPGVPVRETVKDKPPSNTAAAGTTATVSVVGATP